MDDPGLMLRTLTGLKLLGVKLVIDDFGLGYSSLAYLKRLPVDGLKLDRTFAGGVGRDPDAAIVAAVLGLGRALGLAVTNEGVETSEQMRRLRALGCDLAQGYHFSRPLPPADVPLFFRRARAAGGNGRARAGSPPTGRVSTD
jgi:EAL domain-containing protein (putative c-di-GMP-specific phosphodiesterase class I)